MDVGVRELKKRLSELLDRASRGEEIRVTDRGRPKAILGPIRGESRLAQGVAQGWLAAPNGASPKPARRHKSRLRVEDVLDEDRDR